MGRWVIQINVIAITLWYLIIPFAGKLTLFSFWGANYDVSRIIGLSIIYFNTLLLPTINLKKIPILVWISALFFLGYATLLLVIGEYLNQSVNVLVRLYSGFLLFFILYGVDYEGKKEWLENLLLFMGVYIGLFILLQFSLYKLDPVLAVSMFGKEAFVTSYSTLRPHGPLLSAGGAASALTITFLLLLKNFLQHNLRPLHIFIVVVMTMAMLVNLTRTYLFPLVLIIIACLIYYKHFKALIIMLSWVFITILISLTFVPSTHYLDRFRDMPGFASADVSKKNLMQGRGLLLDIVWNDFKKKELTRKITGDGLYHSNKLLGKYFSVAEASTHNDFLWLLSNMGIIGLLFYIAFYLSIIISYRGDYKFLFFCYIFGIILMSGLGGETICVTGHRILQVILLAYFFECSSRGSLLTIKEPMLLHK